MRLESSKGFVYGLAVSGILGLAAFSATAANHECIDSSVVLRHKYVSPQNKEHAAINEVIKVDSAGQRSYTGIFSGHMKNAGQHTVCDDAAVKSCAKVVRNARMKGFQSFRRVKHFSCSANYILSIDQSKKSSKRKAKAPLTSDQYIKKQWAVTNLGAGTAWKRSTGSANVMVAIIDTGVDYTHQDLEANVVRSLGKNFNADTDDAFDDNGHGTHVAGTIGAVGNNGLGVAGMSWNVQIVPVKFLDGSGSGNLGDAVEAIDYVNSLVDQGYPIIASNNSWGGGGFSQPLYDSVKAAQDRGILFFAAAGNEANDNDASPSFPANYNQYLGNVVSVASIDKNGELSWFSNFGNTVDIAAPGEDIASTYPGNQYAYLSGTSMATPHVTGAAALLKAYHPELNGTSLKSLILERVKKNSNLKGSVAGAKQLNLAKLIK